MSRILPLPSDQVPLQSALLARILKALRRQRGLLAIEVAQRMGMKKRTYELFEAGGGKLSLTRLQLFAEATDTDPYAILISLAYGDESFALRCADHKLMTAAVAAIKDFNQEVGEDLRKLDPRLVMKEFDAACERLAEKARERAFPPIEDEPKDKV